MTDEHPPSTLDSAYETGIISFEMDAEGITDVTYVAAAEGPGDTDAGYIDELTASQRVDGQPERINGYTSVGFVYRPFAEVDAPPLDEGLELRSYPEGIVIVEVRLSLTEDAWWTVPVYTADER